jgi:uncharacterized protein YjbI with pentapeptide repeats
VITALPNPQAESPKGSGIKLLSLFLPFIGVFLFLAALMVLAADKTPDKKDTEKEGLLKKTGLVDGADNTGKTFRGRFEGAGEDLYSICDAVFDQCDMQGVVFGNAYFFCRCSFNGAVLTGADFGTSLEDAATYEEGSNGNTLKDAIIHDSNKDIPAKTTVLGYADITETKSYKDKNLRGVSAAILINPPRWNLSGFNLEYAEFLGQYVLIHDASITGATIYSARWVTIMQTATYKTKSICGCSFVGCFFSGADFSGLCLKNCKFIQYAERYSADQKTDLHHAKFTDTDISGCDFSGTSGLTLDQIKQTKNYKNGKMKGIILPPDIQKALDEESKKKTLSEPNKEKGEK